MSPTKTTATTATTAIRSGDWCAYDYDHQCWVTGEPARALLWRQAEEELEVLTSERGEEYATGIGSTVEALLRRVVRAFDQLREDRP